MALISDASEKGKGKHFYLDVSRASLLFLTIWVKVAH